MSLNADDGAKREQPAPVADDASVDALPLPVLAFPVVGIGASAGGLEAFRELLSALPNDTGMAFVLLLHLPAQHESHLADILRRVCSMPLAEVRERVSIEPNHVYVLPGGSDIEMQNGTLALVPRFAPGGMHRPIDHFLRSLAQYQGSRAIAVVLSGTASDGTLGLEEVKAAGGVTFAQDDTAQQNSMPRSAISTGMVDFVLPAADIAHELAQIAKNPLVSASSGDTPPFDLGPVLLALNNAVGVDFSQYKPATLYRRIARRIVLHKLTDPDAYVGLLQKDDDEAHALYQDILINVTSFFRDPEAFDALKQHVFPKLVENRSRHDPIRIWTVACSTGEEAYSVAIALIEFLEDHRLRLPVQLFATDLNAASIDKARLGIYSRASVAGLPPERLRRYFMEVDGSYRLIKSVRDTCVFARHNVLTDPPFSRIDMVSCRNMLIYFAEQMQQRVIPTVHYALRHQGFLWLGSSETIGAYRELFELVDSKHKIYVRRGGPAHMPIHSRREPHQPAVMIPPPPAVDPAAPMRDAHKEVDRLLLARYAPPSVLIREDLEILQYRGDTSSFLAPAPGKASLNLLKMLREGLVMGVRAAIENARKTEMPARQENLSIVARGHERRVSVEVVPIRTGSDRAELFMVIFEEDGANLGAPPAPPPATPADGGNTQLATLRQELSATREYLQSVIAQQESANEELQAANEEVQSSNEELQSINEELETSKEELQSTNEELATVNDELHARNDELAQLSNDLLNLLSSLQIAVVMVDASNRVRRFTPLAAKLLNLIATDIGRSIGDIKSNLDLPNVDTLLHEAMDSMAAQEREVQDREGHWYLLRAFPYRTLENRIDGALMMLVDVDQLKRSEEMLRQQTELLNRAYEPIVMWELDGGITYWNSAAEETYGFTREQALGRIPHELLMTVPPFDEYRSALTGENRWSGELVHTRRDGQKIIVESRMAIVDDTRGVRMVVEAVRPVSERKKAEGVLRRLADDLVAADRNKDEFLAMLAHELRNPLAPLRNIVSLLKSPGAAYSDKERALTMMDRQIQNMVRLVDDLLDVSRITLSQIELRREPLDAGDAVLRVVQQQESSATSRQLKLNVQIDEGLIVDADPVRFEQIIGNLINNACKYTDPGGEIWIRAERAKGEAGEEVTICVKDTGMGIPADKLPQVFNMFMRATRSIDQRYGGLGLGLTLVRRLVELHGGSVSAQSGGPGKGSEFVVRLPAIAATARRAEAASGAPAAAVGRRIMIIDDNVDAGEATAMALRDRGHEVSVAESGAQALDVVRQLSPELVLIDIGMPGMDGYEVAQRLRKIKSMKNAMLVALSGYGDIAAKERAAKSGFNDYLVKPANATDIEAVLEKLRPG